MKTKKKKKFDAVRMMRNIRAKISTETQNMSFEELKNYILENLKTNTKIIASEPRVKYGKKK